MTRASILRKLTAFALAGLTGACGMLKSDRPPEHSWWLEPAQNFSRAGEPHPQVLTVSIDVVPGLNTDRIVTLDPDARLNNYAGARWAEHAPELLESLVVRSLENAGMHADVSARRSNATGACHMELEGRKFHALLGADQLTRSVEIELAGWYDCNGNRKPVRATASIPATGNSMPVVVAAFQRGFDEVMQSLLQQM